jgi:hypothetical protein
MVPGTATLQAARIRRCLPGVPAVLGVGLSRRRLQRVCLAARALGACISPSHDHGPDRLQVTQLQARLQASAAQQAVDAAAARVAAAQAAAAAVSI